MKKWSMWLGLALPVLLFFYPKNGKCEERLEEAMARVAHPGFQNEDLYRDPRFQEFARNFLEHFYLFAKYHNATDIKKDQQGFLQMLKESNGEEEALETTYEQYGLSFSESLDLVNRIDNDVMGLISHFPFLMEMEEQEAVNMVMKQMYSGVQSGFDNWLVISRELTQIAGGLTVSEILDCVGSALGIGGGSILSMGGIAQIAKMEGMHAAVKHAATFVIKKAGWIGVAITAFEFARCIAKEWED